MRRLVIYLFFDPQGRVDAYVTHKLRALRPHAERIFVVVNGELTEEARQRLSDVVDDVWVRENVGFDVWAYKEALVVIGSAELARYDETVLMNYTFFGPVGSFSTVIARMDARADLDFWGMTEHGAVGADVLVKGSPPLARHLQSHWIAVRSSLVTSDEFTAYWDRMPMISNYHDSVTRHEAAFTEHFRSLGFVGEAAFNVEDFSTDHPIMDDAVSLVEAGCPIVKRRSFFHDPLYLDARAVDGRHLLTRMEEAGYPIDLALSNLARTSEPRVMMTNAGLLEVLPDHDLGYDLDNPPKIVAVVHIYYTEMTAELIGRLDFLPVEYDLVITTTGEDRAKDISERLTRLGRSADVRLVGSNVGRDVSAFFVECSDVLLDDDYDLVVKLHTKRSPQDLANGGTMFRRHLLENLLSSPGYVANVLRLFQDHESLGMVFPPVIHIGYPTLGHAWFRNRPRAIVEAVRMGITVPFDKVTPVAAYGSMFIARPNALRRLVEAGYTWDDFHDEAGYTDGGLAHTLERLVAYAALTDGFHVREVLNPQHAATAYKLLEYKYQAVAAELPALALEQAPYVRGLRHKLQRVMAGRQRDRARLTQREMPLDAAPRTRLHRVKDSVSERSPGVARALVVPYRAVRTLYRQAGRAGR